MFNPFDWWSTLDPAHQPAWAQAFLSAVAIVVAGWLPFSVNRNDRMRKIDAYVALIGAVEEEAYGLVMHLKVAEGRRIGPDTRSFDDRASTLTRIPHHDLPDFRLVNLFHDAKEACDEIKRIYDDIASRCAQGNVVRSIDMKLIETQAATLHQCRVDGTRIKNDYTLLRVRNRLETLLEWFNWKLSAIRYWRRKRKNSM